MAKQIFIFSGKLTMHLSLIKDFFTCHANAENKKNNKISAFLKEFPRLNMFSLFKLLSNSSIPEINNHHLKKYLSQFTNNLQIVELHQIKNYSHTKQFSSNKSPTDSQILDKGVDLFLKNWGNNQKIFTFKQLSIFLKGQQSLPQKSQQVPYMAKKKLFQIFQLEIQSLLNIETIHQVCSKQYRNLTDLFQIISNNQTYQIDRTSLKNLYLMYSQRVEEKFLEYLEKRLHLPMSFEKFMEMFKSQQKLSAKTAERKVFYSSVKKKKNHDNYFDEQQSQMDYSNRSNISSSRYQTPTIDKSNIHRNATSTKLTKGDKILQLKQASVNVSRFSFDQSPESYTPKQIQVLGEILHIQEGFIQLKRNLILQRDLDLELVYEREGHKFQEILNRLYGLCNFTSFIRFIVPHDYQHKSLAFIRYQSSNNLSNETISDLQNLIEQFYHKQSQIQSLWEKIDKQMVFRMYCNPCDRNIKTKQLGKYFTQRQCNVLLDRMDPFKSGEITYEYFR